VLLVTLATTIAPVQLLADQSMVFTMAQFEYLFVSG